MKRKDADLVSGLLERKVVMMENIPKGTFSLVSKELSNPVVERNPQRINVRQVVNIEPIMPSRQSVAARKVTNFEIKPKSHASTKNIQTNTPMDTLVEVPKITQPPTLSIQGIRNQPQVDIRTPKIRSQRSTQSIVPQPTKGKTSPEFMFYNDFLRKLPVLSDQNFLPPSVLEPYEIDKEKANLILRKLCKEFKKNLEDAKKYGFKFWFIVEKPFHGCIDSTFSKGHSLISRLPSNFRIQYLPKLLNNCEFKEAGITHVVLTITANWITEFDVSAVIAKDEYEHLFRELTTIFHKQGIKKAMILTCPFTQEQQRSAESHNLIVMQALFVVNKENGGDKLFDIINYQSVLDSKGLSHGNDGFREILKQVGANYFNEKRS